MKKAVEPKFKFGDVCIFTNRMNEFKLEDGKLCLIVGVKPEAHWHNSKMPEYFIRFHGRNSGFGVIEPELKHASDGET